MQENRQVGKADIVKVENDAWILETKQNADIANIGSDFQILETT